MMNTTILSVEDVRTVIHHVGLDALMDETIDGIVDACREFDDGKFEVPVRQGFDYTVPDAGLLEWMPAMRVGGHAMLKVVGYHPTNPGKRELPTILSVAMTFDTESGHLIGLLDGTFPTAIRTGAASAVASRVLASKDSKILGLIGAGSQAVAQLHAISRVFDLEEVLVFDTDAETSRSFSQRAAFMDKTGIAISPCAIVELVSRSDIICTSTSVDIGGGPVFDDSGLKPWVHINAVGSDFPGKTEVPLSVLRRSLVCPDFTGQAVKEGECQQLSGSEIGPDLVKIVNNVEAYLRFRDKPTVFDSTGWAMEDHVVIDILLHHARELGCGSAVSIESISADPRNPYKFALREPRQGDIIGEKDLAKPWLRALP